MAHGYRNDREPLLSTSGTFSSSYGSFMSEAPPSFSGNRALVLPDGKTHHLFFSHSSDDQQWVEMCVERLERDYGIKCLWPPRDFTPGKSIPSLIEDGMSRAMKIVLVLSPEYIDSGWCSYERHLAFVLSVQERRNCIIPVMLKPCPVPDVLRTVNYIDVTKGENADCKIANALYQKCELQDILPNFNRQYHQEDINGATISVAAKKEGASKIRGTAWCFDNLSLYQHQLLKNMGSEISRDVHDLAVSRINSLFYMRCFGLIKSGPPLFCFIGIFVVFVFFLMGIIGVIIVNLMKLNSFLLLVIIGSVEVVVPLLYVPFRAFMLLKVRKQGIRNAKNIVKNISLEWFQQTKLLIHFRQDYFPIITFMYYDTKPCQLYIRDCFLRLYAASPDDAEKEALASNVASHHIRQFLENHYDRVLEWNDLEESVTQRHVTVMRKQCLCEMMERDLWPQQMMRS
ncbi:uncharacterized protein LOC121368383 [Gigantopelta aegis]|uniref:uncharacterized protein LOC121368383 n=1 Tax=Gigantopelta aegis TaxID=1735272 RepID=UPI001B88CD18|nr:uncharacterized protein LOC121368383 [Gigantopelta aegis]XP_041349013.1 uncharacterized protein LOC121368383 [Gigantopelta aegis]